MVTIKLPVELGTIRSKDVSVIFKSKELKVSVKTGDKEGISLFDETLTGEICIDGCNWTLEKVDSMSVIEIVLEKKNDK